MRLLTTFAVTMMLVSGMAFGQDDQEVKLSVPQDAVNELQYFVGEWNIEGKGTSGAIEGKWMAKWAPGKQCLIIDYRGAVGGEAFRGNGMWGWDSTKKEFLVVIFFTHDVLEVIRTKIVSPNVFKGRYTAQVKGEPVDAKSELRKEGKDSWTFTATDVTLGDKKAEGLSVKLTRMK